MTRIGLVLNGCGFKDGSEIHESVLAMLALEEAGATLDIIAPAKPQKRVVNHLTGQEIREQRSMIEEAARIARGRIRPLAEATPSDMDGLVIPGGYGAALNLCDFAARADGMEVDRDLEKLLLGLHESGKPIGAICIAPVILARVFGRLHPRLTIGSDQGTAESMRKMGAEHVNCAVNECVTDQQNRLVTTPAYMLGESVRDIHQGIRKLAQQVVLMATSRGQ